MRQEGNPELKSKVIAESLQAECVITELARWHDIFENTKRILSQLCSPRPPSQYSYFNRLLPNVL